MSLIFNYYPKPLLFEQHITKTKAKSSFLCSVLHEEGKDVNIEVKLEDIFGGLEVQIKAIKYFKQIADKRSNLLELRNIKFLLYLLVIVFGNKTRSLMQYSRTKYNPYRKKQEQRCNVWLLTKKNMKQEHYD